jgi:hypothetical protein
MRTGIETEEANTIDVKLWSVVAIYPAGEQLEEIQG